MRCAYVLMYKKAGQFEPYAVFEDSITAERMKRPGDEVAMVPLIIDPSALKDDTPSLNAIPCDKNVTVTYSGTQPWSAEGTLAPFDPPSYPKVTCNKTVDEHKWTNRSD